MCSEEEFLLCQLCLLIKYNEICHECNVAVLLLRRKDVSDTAAYSLFTIGA